MKKSTRKTIIEFATEKDLKLIIKGIKEICNIEKQKPKKEAILINNIKKAIRNKRIIIAKRDNKKIGFIQFTFSNKEPYGLDYGKRKKYCWIEWMYVVKNCRRKGIGDIMFKNIINICKKNRVNEVMLDVFEVNKNAREFYKKERFDSFINIMKKRI